MTSIEASLHDRREFRLPRALAPQGIPLHPPIVSVAVGAWVCSSIFDGLSYSSEVEWIYARGAYVLVAIGIGAALLGATVGLVDLMGLDRSSEAFRVGVRHIVLTDVAIALFAISFLIRRSSDFAFHESVAPVAVLVNVAGLGVLAFGMWAGGALTYRHGVGVEQT